MVMQKLADWVMCCYSTKMVQKYKCTSKFSIAFAIKITQSSAHLAVLNMTHTYIIPLPTSTVFIPGFQIWEGIKGSETLLKSHTDS